MIITFGLILFITLIIFTILAYQQKLPYHIPIILVFLIIVLSIFFYLGKKNIEGYANWDNSVKASLDIFYTNAKNDNKKCNGCPGICDPEEPDYDKKRIPLLHEIDNPIQSSIGHQKLDPVFLNAQAGSHSQGTGFSITLTPNNPKNKIASYNIDESLYFLNLPINQLKDFGHTQNNKRLLHDNLKKLNISNYNVLTELISKLSMAPEHSYIIIATSGDNISGITKGSETEKSILKNKYNVQYLTQMQSGDSYIGILHKDKNGNFTDIKQIVSPKNNSTGAFINNLDLIRESTAIKMNFEGQEFKPVPVKPVKSNPYANAKYILISPTISSTKTYLVFSYEDNQSFVYLSPRTPEDQFVLYNQSPKEKKGPQSSTILNTEEPQRWVLEPVYETGLDDVYFLRTHTKPHFYLEVNTDGPNPEVKTNIVKGGNSQYWQIIIGKDGNTLIKNSRTNLYLSYSMNQGYLYEDTGSVGLSQSKKFTWKIAPFGSNGKRVPPLKKNKFIDFTSPTDYGNNPNPIFNLQGKINNKMVDISSNGRSGWNKYYTKLWNGNWIYYGTIQTNGQQFLQININEDGNGTVIDPFFNYKTKLYNAGSNILFATINGGQFDGFNAVFEMLPVPLEYQSPKESYPVKMRYLVFRNDQQIYSLSSTDMNNLNAYSVKNDGKYLIMSNFLESSGVPVDLEKALPKL